MCRQWCANQCWLACLPTVVGEPANGGWHACQCWLASQVTSISIYRPRSFRSKYKFFLSVRLASSRFDRTGSIRDLDRVIETYERAGASGPDDSLYLRSLSDALQRRFEKTGSNDDLINAIAMNEKASVLPTATPFLQIRAAQSASKLLIGKDNNRAKT